MVVTPIAGYSCMSCMIWRFCLWSSWICEVQYWHISRSTQDVCDIIRFSMFMHICSRNYVASHLDLINKGKFCLGFRLTGNLWGWILVYRAAGQWQAFWASRCLCRKLTFESPEQLPGVSPGCWGKTQGKPRFLGGNTWKYAKWWNFSRRHGNGTWKSTVEQYTGQWVLGELKGGQLVFFWKEGKYAKLDLQQS